MQEVDQRVPADHEQVLETDHPVPPVCEDKENVQNLHWSKIHPSCLKKVFPELEVNSSSQA